MVLKDGSISVVLGVYNQGEILRSTLVTWSMACTSYSQGSELIICDDGSDDSTQQVVEEFMEANKGVGLRIVYLRQERGKTARLAMSLNMAKEYVNGEYVLFAMGDSYPRDRLLMEYKDDLDSNTILSGVRYNIRAPFNYSFVTPDYRMYDYRFESIEVDKKPWEVFTGNNFVIPKAVLDDIGWWNAEFQGYGGEDWELAALARLKRHTLFKSVHSASVYHVNHPVRDGSGDPDYYLASWTRQLVDRYSRGDFNRSTKALKPRPPKAG